METIYHERQEGQLCAQHCLNNLLQENHFTAVELARIADRLDQEEAATLAEGGLDSPELMSFSNQPSSNMDDSGYFSVQVISRALSVWNLTMTLWNSPDMKAVMENPIAQKAFICNHDNHWLTIRKLGRQWFNLNSLLPKPKLISDTYLSLFLTQLQMEGYHIFVIVGTLPPCEADELLTLIPVEPTPQGRKQRETKSQRSLSPSEKFDADLAAAMSASLSEGGDTHREQSARHWADMETYDVELATAISMSMQDHVSEESKQGASSSAQPQSTSEHHLPTDGTPTEREGGAERATEELRQKRLKHLGQS